MVIIFIQPKHQIIGDILAIINIIIMIKVIMESPYE